MALEDDLRTEVATIFREAWTKRAGQKVPEPADLKLGNDAVEFDRATVLYADLSGSTAMVNAQSWSFAAEIYKTYLACATRIVKDRGGVITSYDGDRVMGIYIGDSQSTSAAESALRINYAVNYIINPALKKQYSTSTYEVRQVVGIDTSAIRAARTGVRGDNDIVWIGRAANYAAKLTELKLSETSWVTGDVYDQMNISAKNSSRGVSMWKKYDWSENNNYRIYGSTWWRSI